MSLRYVLTASAAIAAFSGASQAQESQPAPAPWTIQEAANLPEWLTVSGSFRARYESLSDHFRVGASKNDQLVSYRTTLFAEARAERIRAGIEIFDSRAYESDAGGTVGTGEVNVLEPVQAYIGFDLGESIAGGTSDLLVGRFTFDLGSRRLVGRNNFRNTTNAFTGALFSRTSGRGDKLTAFYSVPQTRLPSDKASILDNDFELDEESEEIVFWGAFYELPKFAGDINAEFYIFGLQEDDSNTVATANRQLYTPGARFFTKPAKAAWDWEIEGGWQFGETRASTSPADTRDLDVSAQFLHGDIGYTFDAPWQPRLEVNYNYASGDDEAGDDEWNRFDSLYGPRRPDFGPTGIFGALSRVNINAPGIKLDVKPNSRWDGFIEYKSVWLADENDRFDRGRQSDPTGQSGSFAGHYLQARARYWIGPKSVRLDFGGAALFEGEFLEDAPNATGNGDSVYGYADITWQF